MKDKYIAAKERWAAKRGREIIFLDRAILGFLEMRGNSNTADPWIDARFV